MNIILSSDPIIGSMRMNIDITGGSRLVYRHGTLYCRSDAIRWFSARSERLSRRLASRRFFRGRMENNF